MSEDDPRNWQLEINDEPLAMNNSWIGRGL
jgi:hypothetical protein